ncbi:HD domain-containing protein [Micromonospora sp. NPDC049801]|uniref:HD domain-containing protein n=1 Tax=unclassified Micromonospora TaxID=2617518 RepID=UPI0033C6B0DE
MTNPTVADADCLAATAHTGQVDKAGRPYIEHPRAVAAMLAEHGDNAVMAGLLHDVVEDTPITLNDLRAAGYPDEVVSAVDAVSRREGETYMDMIRRASAHPLGRLVKLADNRHNSSEERLAHLDPENAEFLRRRYAKARAVLLAGKATTGV